MNAYAIYDAIEQRREHDDAIRILREEKEFELANNLERGLSQHLFESLCVEHLQRHGANKKAISRAFDNDVEFQERAAEFIRYMAETFSRHQIDIELEDK
ncbi:gam [Salmonella enterica]|nr:gam [Salmonella enterica]EKS4863238.1 gam [Salmonella enterica]EKS4880570.1 gam [Salmonella enterica]EKS4885029.1 gam [Salmonella enterica]EKS5974623.1 gam [Salmonella enterica]